MAKISDYPGWKKMPVEQRKRYRAAVAAYKRVVRVMVILKRYRMSSKTLYRLLEHLDVPNRYDV